MGKPKKAAPSASTDPATDLRKAAALAFGAVARRLRKARGLTQEQLSWESKINRTFISNIECGHSEPTFTTILRLSRMLGIDPGDLVRQAVEELNSQTT